MINIKAIFSSGNITVGGITRPAGIYSKILLNSFTDKNEQFPIEEALKKEIGTIESALESLLIPEMLIETPDICESLCRCLQVIRSLFPFNISDERRLISDLFSARTIHDVNILKQSRKLKAANPCELWSTFPQLVDAQFVIRTVKIESEMKDCLLFFENICHDSSIAYSEIKKIADSYSEIAGHHETNLLAEALWLLKNRNTLEIKTEYGALYTENLTLGRKMIFTSYRDFIISDLFEGIHYGHYARKCISCKRYFFMTKAYNQQVCNGRTDYPRKYGKGFYTCREYAVILKRRDKAKDDPIKHLYTSRCSQLRRSKSRGIISEGFYKAAVSVASAHKEKALYNADYANHQYEQDMAQSAVYAETERKLKNV
ncbi:MAG: hypothetical protein KBT46_08740 [Ruminococcus sp.]|nr:hypothetical protein [Candidatus Copronaster equi]